MRCKMTVDRGRAFFFSFRQFEIDIVCIKVVCMLSKFLEIRYLLGKYSLVLSVSKTRAGRTFGR